MPITDRIVGIDGDHRNHGLCGENKLTVEKLLYLGQFRSIYRFMCFWDNNGQPDFLGEWRCWI